MRGTGSVGKRGRVEFYNFPKSSLTRVNFLEKMTFGQRFEGDERESQLTIWGMSRLC